MKLIIFDFDGTLFDTFDSVYYMLKNILLEYNFKIKNKKDFSKIYNENFYETMKKDGIKGKRLNKLKKETALLRLKTAEEIGVFKGIPVVLKELKKKYKLAIISSSFGKSIKKSLKHSGILKYFDFVIGAEKEESKVKKIKLCMRKFKLKNSEVIYVGDTSGDVVEAKKAKVKSIAVSWGYQNKEMLKKARPDLIVNKIKDLIEL
jgi:phosphoglycolate phosphatase